MKNILIIDADTERTPQITIKKPKGFETPNTKEEAKSMLLNDISCSFDAICQMIQILHDNQYANKKEITKILIDDLNTLSNKD